MGLIEKVLGFSITPNMDIHKKFIRDAKFHERCGQCKNWKQSDINPLDNMSIVSKCKNDFRENYKSNCSNCCVR